MSCDEIATEGKNTWIQDVLVNVMFYNSAGPGPFSDPCIAIYNTTTNFLSPLKLNFDTQASFQHASGAGQAKIRPLALLAQSVHGRSPYDRMQFGKIIHDHIKALQTFEVENFCDFSDVWGSSVQVTIGLAALGDG